jgi:O-acetylserine/cysteine efflux transporter
MSLIVAFIWGTNFVAIKMSLESVEPIALIVLRFIATLIPAVFLIKRPSLPWKDIAILSLFQWIGQFVFLFLGMAMGVQPGIASLLMQSQSIFTIVWSIAFFHHKPLKGELVGLACAIGGISLIAYERYEGGSVWGFLLLILGGISVSIANILFSRIKANDDHPLSLIVWTSVFVPVPLYLLSAWMEGPLAVWEGLQQMTMRSGVALGYTVFFSTLVAATLWAILLRRYSPSLVVPFTVLIPVFAMGSSTLILDEQFSFLSLWASGLILLGLVINQISRHRVSRKSLRPTS